MGKPGPINKALYDGLVALWKAAVREFIREIIKSDVIRVETGMSKSTLLPLSRLVRISTELSASIQPKVFAKLGYTSITGAYDPNASRTAPRGEALGRNAYVLNFGNQKRPVFSFKFRIVVYQYLLHEIGIVPGTGPWNSLEIGRVAFINFLDTNYQKYIPLVGHYFVTGNIVYPIGSIT